MHPAGSDWHLHGAAPPYATAPAAESSPTASLDPTSHLAAPHHHEGVVWLDAPPPQTRHAAFPHFYSLDTPSSHHGHHPPPPRLAHDPAAAIQAPFDPESALSQQHQHLHQYQPYPQQHYAPPSHAADPPQQYPPPPDLKRRRVSHDQYFEADLVDQRQQHGYQASPGWQEQYEQYEVEGGMTLPASGAALRRPSDATSSSRRDSAQLVEGEVIARRRAMWGTDPATAAANLRLSPHLASSASPSFSLLPAASGTAAAGSTTYRPEPIPVAQPPAATANAHGLEAQPKPHRTRQPRDDAGQAGLADKSCKQCRIRKVRCTRTWPVCARCTSKDLPCHYGNLVPIDLVKTMQPEARVAELETRIKSLEIELAMSLAPSSSSKNLDSDPTSSSLSPARPPSAIDLPDQILCAMTTALGDTLSSERLEAHTAAILRSACIRADELAAAAAPPGKKSHDVSSTPSSAAYTRFAQQAVADAQLVCDELDPLSPDERLRHPSWARLVTWSLLDACWATCSSNTPVFRPFHPPEAKSRLYVDVERLSAPERCVVLAMCALGVRSTAELDVLGMAGLDVPPHEPPAPAAGYDDQLPRAAQRSVAVQRELVARALRTLMLDLYDRLEVAHGEGDEEALKATGVCGAMMMWNELLPRRSRSLVRVALGHYRDLFDATSTLASPGAVAAARTHLLGMYALPLLHQDATTSAYLRMAPLITDADLDEYFAPFAIPILARADSGEWSLRKDMLPWIDVDRLGGNDHKQLLTGGLVIYKWLAACLRWCAQMSCARSFSAPISARALDVLFGLISQIHSTIQVLQHHLTHSPSPIHPTCLGPDGDTCDQVHLRWCARLDRETDDCIWLAFATVGERMMRDEGERSAWGEAKDEEEGRQRGGDEEERVDLGWLQRCEGQVRQGLKRAAFYFNCFVLSPDPHQTHHLALELELIPSWTFLATQRFTSSSSSITSPSSRDGGPIHKADELSEKELDWIERGLEVASLYHPVAERRLVELRAHREAERARVAQLVGAGTSSFPFPAPVHMSLVVRPSLKHAGSSQGPGRKLDFQEAMREALAQTVPSWA
ncbi:hypothetical protein JCM9279_007484 [Rhodotorula babjevae]